MKHSWLPTYFGSSPDPPWGWSRAGKNVSKRTSKNFFRSEGFTWNAVIFLFAQRSISTQCHRDHCSAYICPSVCVCPVVVLSWQSYVCISRRRHVHLLTCYRGFSQICPKWWQGKRRSRRSYSFVQILIQSKWSQQHTDVLLATHVFIWILSFLWSFYGLNCLLMVIIRAI